MNLLASIPSPSTNVLKIGPVPLHVYGLMIALGVVAAVWICRWRWAAWGNNPDEIVDMAYWAVPGGLIGARLYHVATDFNRLYVHNLAGIPKIWDGGLGIPGGILGGVLTGYVYARHKHMNVPDLLDMVAPALPLAQAIGRWGNYFNQELFGRPTTLPWGLQIDVAHRGNLPPAYVAATTFHPTFLYEMLWNLVLVAVILGLDSRRNKGGVLPTWIVASFYGMFAVGFGLDTLLVVQRQTGLGTAVQATLFVVGAALGALLVRWVTQIGPKGPQRRGDLFWIYIAGYFLGRLWVESLRIDTANLILGLRLNEWTALLAGAGALLVLFVRRHRPGIPPIEPLVPADDDVAAGGEAAEPASDDADEETSAAEVADHEAAPPDS